MGYSLFSGQSLVGNKMYHICVSKKIIIIIIIIFV